jgi:membrane associated rhomboid family serine protease
MNYNKQLSINFSITPIVKWLMIVCVAIWFVGQVLLEKFVGIPLTSIFALFPAKVIFEFQIWQLFTYMFLHSYNVSHLLFNMLMLWFLGVSLEERWGARFFLSYYLGTGVGAAIFYCLGNYLYYWVNPGQTMGLVVPVVGASGAIFGLLLAYGILFADRTIYAFMVFPMKAKYFVMMLGAIEFSNLITSEVSGGDVAYLAHLGGLASGYLMLWFIGRWQRLKWNQKLKKRTTGLKLVVDNNNEPKEPRFWN